MSVLLANGDANQFPGGVPPNGALSSLSPEAVGTRTSFTTQQALLDSVENELSSMEQTDLKKMRLYKIALIVLTIVGMAVLFILPVCMVFGVSIWVPIVISLGASLIFGAIGNKLKARCQEIRLKYRSLQVYHKQLLRRFPGLKDSTLAKYNIQIPKKESFKQKMLAQLRPDLNQIPYDGGAALDQKLDLSGEMNSRYQCDALLGIGSANEASWQKRVSEVLNAKTELLKNNSAYAALRTISNSALQETGMDIPKMLPQMDLIGLAQSLMGICGFGGKVGLDIRQSIDKYERTFLHSQTFSSWTANFSPATRLYLSQGTATIDLSLNIFSKLKNHVNTTLSASWAVAFENWQGDVIQFVEEPGLTQLYKKIISNAHKLNTHEGVDAEKLEQVRSILGKLKELVQEHQAGNAAAVNAKKNDICRSMNRILETVYLELGGTTATSPRALFEQTQKDFLQYLVSLGNMSVLFDKIHMSIQLGRFVREDMENAVQRHPDNQRIRILGAIDQLSSLVNGDNWGAISGKPVEEILKEKAEIVAYLDEIRTYVANWSVKYERFKSLKLSRVLMKDFSESYANIDAKIDKLNSSQATDRELNDFISNCRDTLGAYFAELGGDDVLPNEEQIKEWAQEYIALIGELDSILPACQAAANRVQGQGATGARMLLQALTNKESALSDKTKTKEAELVKAIQETRPAQDTGELLNHGIAQLEAIIQGMMSFEQSIQDPKQLVVEEITRTSNELFTAMQDGNSTKLADLEALLSSSTEGLQASATGEAPDSAAQTVSAAQKVAWSGWQARNKDLDSFLKEVQKMANKWNMGQTIVMGITGLVLLVVGLALMSLQMTWLPVGLAAAALVLQILPLFFNRIIEKKTFDVRAATLAKEFLPSSKILTSEFDNPDLQRLGQLQDVLNLEGYEQSWAREVIKDLDASPTDKQGSDFKSTKKLLKGYSKELDKRIKKRFGPEKLEVIVERKQAEERTARAAQEDAPGAPPAPAVQPPAPAAEQVISPEEAQRIANMPAIQQRLDGVVAEIANIEAEENMIISHRMRFDMEKSRYLQQRAYRDQLKSQLEDNKAALPDLEKQMVENQTAANLLSQVLSQKTSEPAQKQEVAIAVESLQNMISKVYDSSLSHDERQQAKRNFDFIISNFAQKGQLSSLKDVLEVSACLGRNEIRFDRLRSEQLSGLKGGEAVLPQGGEQAAIAEREVENRKKMLEYLGLSTLTPFVKFAYSTVPGSGRAMAIEALGAIQVVKAKLDAGDAVTQEEYKKAQRKLSAYLEQHKQLTPLAYGQLLGNEEFLRSAQMIREEHGLQEIVAINTLIGFQNLCSFALQRIDKWIDRKISKRENREVFRCLMESIHSSESSDSQGQEQLRDVYSKLVNLPEHILLRMMKQYKTQSLIATEKVQNIQDMEKRLLMAGSVVEEKDKMFAGAQDKWEEELNLLAQKLEELNARKTLLTAEKARLQDGLNIRRNAP
ncbi:hypothetical protein [Chlamydia vaughanii]|uniref:hypothetical protein n=1 Tax=Chlamydia vaughanii TaxID=3112552 RepID=UPI0032B2E374